MSEPGLTDDELSRIEAALGFEFADDHRAFLAAGMPMGAGWPNWRAGVRSLRPLVQLPVEGILHAVEWNDFWPNTWGSRPARTKDALRSANYHLDRAPRLIPVRGHHYLPAGHGSTGRPVLSVIRTDVTVAGATLADYLSGEDGAGEPAFVEFWSDLISGGRA